jgi:hypothetical protein
LIAHIAPSDVESLQPLLALTSAATVVRHAAWLLAVGAVGVGVMSLIRAKRVGPLAVALLLIVPVVGAEAMLAVEQRELNATFDGYRPVGLMTVTGEVTLGGVLLIRGAAVERKIGETEGPLGGWLCGVLRGQQQLRSRLAPENNEPQALWVELAQDADAKTFTSVVELAAESGFGKVAVVGAPPDNEKMLEHVPAVHRPMMAARYARQGFTFDLTPDAPTKLPEADLTAFVRASPKAVFMEPRESRCAPERARRQRAQTQLSPAIIETLIPDGALPAIKALWSETKRTFIVGRLNGDKDVGLLALGGSSFHAGFTQWDEESEGVTRRAQAWADSEGLSPLALVDLEDIDLRDPTKNGRAIAWDGHKLEIEAVSVNPPKLPKNVAMFEPQELAVSPDGQTLLVRWRPLDKQKKKAPNMEPVDGVYDVP